MREVPDEYMKGIVVGNPADQAAVGGERYDGIALDAQMSVGCLAIIGQQRIDEAEQLHHSLILAKILVT